MKEVKDVVKEKIEDVKHFAIRMMEDSGDEELHLVFLLAVGELVKVINLLKKLGYIRSSNLWVSYYQGENKAEHRVQVQVDDGKIHVTINEIVGFLCGKEWYDEYVVTVDVSGGMVVIRVDNDVEKEIELKLDEDVVTELLS